jgi:2-amino-4-hydroxy-6-hydroxymethyldihydropteridine diphosphokinase
MTEEIFLSLGANIGDRAASLDRALDELRRQEVLPISRSSFYLTDPVGLADQPRFLNIACRVGTVLEPGPLLEVCLSVEAELGRVRHISKGPRIIDIDILFYGDRVIHTPRLVVPHPELHARNFVLTPLTEIAPGFVDPRSRKTVSELHRECRDRAMVVRLADDQARRLPSG